jgi:ferredoxin
MIVDWEVNRRPDNRVVPEWELIKTPEMQFRRELTLLHQEVAFQKRIPLYSVLAVEALSQPEDMRLLTDELPEARAAILLGTPIEDPWNRLWHRVAGLSMNSFTTVATSIVEIMLLSFAEKLEYQGYKAIIRQLPLTPTNHYTRLFELAGAGFTGKNHLVITEKYGCRVSLGVIITDAPLLHGDFRYRNYSHNLCGECTRCEDYCPSGALRNGHYDQAKCEAYVNEPANQLRLSPHTTYKCDACMRICPLGELGKWDSTPVHWATILEEKKINY